MTETIDMEKKLDNQVQQTKTYFSHAVYENRFFVVVFSSPHFRHPN